MLQAPCAWVVGDDREERLMATFEKTGTGTLITLEEGEADVLRTLLGEMEQVITQEAAVDDAVIDRLFPAAYADPKDARAFTELVGDELRAGKLHSIARVRDALPADGPATALVSDPDPWLTVLTDLRLALGTRLEVTEETMDLPLSPGGPRANAMAVLHWLGWLQGSLLETITTEVDR